jgi:hypothetical protein
MTMDAPFLSKKIHSFRSILHKLFTSAHSIFATVKYFCNFCKGDRFVFQTLNLLIFLFKLLLRRPNYLQAYFLISRLIPRKSRCRTFKSPGYYFPVIIRALSPIAHPVESSIASHSKIGICRIQYSCLGTFNQLN